MRINEMFPQCEVSDDTIKWIGAFKDGHFRSECQGVDCEAYIHGDKESLVLDGGFTREQLEALVEWMGKAYEDRRT